MRAETKQKLKVGFSLAAAILIPLAVGAFSAFLTAEDMKGYETLPHPALAPPGWIFPIVWTILYVTMGIASYLVYAADTAPETKRRALRPYAAQLAMNLFWSTLFFTYTRYLVSLLWLVGMWVLTLIAAVRFFRIRRAAGVMMSVLLLWSSFAAYLNFSYYAMRIT